MVLLCILDGFGYREASADNAVAAANTPNFDKLIATCPHTLIEYANTKIMIDNVILFIIV